IGRATFLADPNERGSTKAARQSGGQTAKLIERFNIALRQNESARSNHVQQWPCIGVRHWPMEAKPEQLTDLFFESQAADIFHDYCNCAFLRSSSNVLNASIGVRLLGSRA